MILQDHLLDLEQQLLTPGTRTNPAALIHLLTPEFREFGSSGRIFDRESVLCLLQSEPDYSPPEVLDFEARELTPEFVLVTYKTTRNAIPVSNRSSLWTLRDNRWQLLFHQGTRIP